MKRLSLRMLHILSVLTIVLILAATVSGVAPRPAYACSGATEDLTLEYYIEQADAIAVVRVTEVGGAANETPPFPPGTPPDHPGIGGGSGIPEDFHFDGYRAQAEVIEVIKGSLPAAIEIDRALRAQMERVVRQYELGNRLVPCFFGMQQRYQPDANYVVFLEKTNEGWNTVRQYELSGDQVTLGRPGVLLSPQHRPLIVGEETYSAVFSAFNASETDPNTGEYGQLWVIQEEYVALDVVKQAIAQLTGSSVTPPATGSGGLR